MLLKAIFLRAKDVIRLMYPDYSRLQASFFKYFSLLMGLGIMGALSDIRYSLQDI